MKVKKKVKSAGKKILKDMAGDVKKSMMMKPDMKKSGKC